ncbi:TetR family transcriptional regulator [Piscinibacterium candidicorallinum]|uniref:TetR family transcriptional regulator n=1 Tax=Piscinibacterium candidicorallinum TaxID=1793872 RepID=A0ABV7H792_9BURK
MSRTSKSPGKQEGITRPRRDRGETTKDLQRALQGLQEAGARVSISAVAAAVGVTPGLIHNKYPAVAEAIRLASGRTVKARLTDLQQQLQEALARNAELRKENAELLHEVRDLASVNESIRQQLAVARATATGKVVRIPTP